MTMIDRLRYHGHGCGGTILTGPAGDYCDACRAFNNTDDDFPTGVDPKKNRAAYDDGDDRSPDCLIIGCSECAQVSGEGTR